LRGVFKWQNGNRINRRSDGGIGWLALTIKQRDQAKTAIMTMAQEANTKTRATCLFDAI